MLSSRIRSRQSVMPNTNKRYVFTTASGQEDKPPVSFIDNRYMTAYKTAQFNGKPYNIRENFNLNFIETLNNLDFVHKEIIGEYADTIWPVIVVYPAIIRGQIKRNLETASICVFHEALVKPKEPDQLIRTHFFIKNSTLTKENEKAKVKYEKDLEEYTFALDQYRAIANSQLGLLKTKDNIEKKDSELRDRTHAYNTLKKAQANNPNMDFKLPSSHGFLTLPMKDIDLLKAKVTYMLEHVGSAKLTPEEYIKFDFNYKKRKQDIENRYNEDTTLPVESFLKHADADSIIGGYASPKVPKVPKVASKTPKVAPKTPKRPPASPRRSGTINK